MSQDQFERLEKLLVHIAGLLHELVYTGHTAIYENPTRGLDNCGVCKKEEISDEKK